MNSHHRLLHLVLLLVCLCNAAISQQETGTIVVFNVGPDDATIAADSRAVRPKTGGEIVRDNQCKILAFDNKLVFAASGYEARFQPNSDQAAWSIYDVARSVYRKIAQQGSFPREGLGVADEFAKAWANRMLRMLAEDSKISLPKTGESGIVNGAVIIDFDALGQLEARGVVITEVNGKITSQIIPLARDGMPMGAGETEVLNEFMANTTNRAKKWHTVLDKLPRSRQVLELVRLTERYDTSGTVGGPIQALVIRQSGIHWLNKPAYCQEHTAPSTNRNH